MNLNSPGAVVTALLTPVHLDCWYEQHIGRTLSMDSLTSLSEKLLSGRCLCLTVNEGKPKIQILKLKSSQ